MPHLKRKNPNLFTNETGHRKVGQSWKTLKEGGDSNVTADYTITPSDDDIAILNAGQTVGNEDSDSQSDFQQALEDYQADGSGGEDWGKWTTADAAHDAAINEGGMTDARRIIGQEGVPVEIPANFELSLKDGWWTYNLPRQAESGSKSYSIQVSPINGDIIAINRADPQDMQVVEKAPTSPPMGSDKVGGLIPNGDGSFTQPYEIIDSQGRSRIHYVKVAAANVTPTEKDIITFDKEDGGGRLIPLGGGKYTYEPPEDEPFTTSPSDVVPLPNQNGSLIKTSANQYQFVRDTFDPGRKVDETGREYLQQIDGSWSELAPRFEPGFIERADGMNLFQQRSGQVTQLSAATMDDVITQALIDGDVDKALAFQDFRDRPTAQEAFNTALEFARSPADQRIISSIARGITPVQPPPEGTIQRVGPQPDFLVQAYEDFQRRTQAGRAPTGEEISAATEDPTLQARLESIANKDRREEEKHQLFITSEEGKQRRAQEAFEAQETTRAAESAAKIAASNTAATGGDTGDTGDIGNTGDAETGAEAVVETDDGTTTEADALRA